MWLQTKKQAALYGNDEGVGRGQAEEEHLGALLHVQNDAAAGLEPAQGGDGRPGHADQEPVGPGHVGDGVGVVRFRVLARLPGEVHVDCP